MDQSTWLRFAEVGDVTVDGGEAEAVLTPTTVEDAAPVTVQLHKDGGAWAVDLDDSMTVHIAVSPAGAPASIQVGTCDAAVVDGVSTVVLPPGEFDVVLGDPSGVLGTQFAEEMTKPVELPGSGDLSFELDDLPLSAASLEAINEAVSEAEESCASLDFAGLNCPPGAVGAVAFEGAPGLSLGDPVGHEFVDGTWSFATAPQAVKYSFEGAETWTDVMVAYSGILVSPPTAGQVTASILEVTS
ncbi:hypothetical protein [Demequina aurantiaca]|uniref:hypothetical protein n=1 Tax=Demequina aurantiaca TaxID=676200 RepID=UPI003D32AEA9